MEQCGVNVSLILIYLKALSVQLQKMVDKCEVKYEPLKPYEQFIDIQCLKCSCVNEMRLFSKTKCLMPALKAAMALTCQSWQGPTVIPLSRRCSCKLIS